MKRSIAAITLAALLSALATANATPVTSFRTVALSEAPSPGATGGTFDEFRPPIINALGKTVFAAGANLPNLTSRRWGIWSEVDGSLQLAALSGNPVPGSEDTRFGGVSTSSYRATNDTTIVKSSIVEPGRDAYSVLLEVADFAAIQFVAEGHDTPTTKQSTFSFFLGNVSINPSGKIAFFDLIYGPELGIFERNAIFSGQLGSLSTVIQAGDATPGIANAFFRMPKSPLINHNGEVAFSSSYRPLDNSGGGLGVWAQRNGELELIVESGEIAPDTSGAVFSSSLGRKIGFNNAGHVAFIGNVKTPNVSDSNRHGIWVEKRGSITRVALEGAEAPGANGAIFSQFGGTVAFGDVNLNGRGDVVFTAVLNGPTVTIDNTNGIWMHSESGTSLLVRGGDDAPGATGGKFSTFGRPLLNRHGQTAFSANLKYPDNDNIRGRDSIWVRNPDDTLQLIVNEGDEIDVDDSPFVEDLRIVTDVELFSDTGAGGEDGKRTSFNDLGQLAFLLEFSDGSSGIFVANTVIPEPASVSIVAACCLFICCSRPLAARARV